MFYQNKLIIHRYTKIVIFLILIFSCKDTNSLKMQQGNIDDEKYSSANIVNNPIQSRLSSTFKHCKEKDLSSIHPSIKIPETLNDLKYSASPYEYAILSKHTC